jgi:general secretion pathway protein G
MKTQVKRNTGFTLVEILIALTILVLLAGGGIVAYQKVLVNANNKAAGLAIQDSKKAINLYITDMMVAPDTESGWDALMTEPEDDAKKKKWSGGPYITAKPVDPWGYELKYEKIEDGDGLKTFKVWSVGPDGDDGTDDDIKVDAEEDE